MHPKLQRLAASINAAHLANEKGDFKQAEQLCKEALKIDKTIPEAWYNLGIAHRGQKKLKEAKHAQIKALRLSTHNPDAQNSIGLELYELHENAIAEKVFRDTIKKQPGYALAYSNLARILDDQGKAHDALIFAEKSVALEKNEPGILTNYASILNSLEQRDSAKSALEKALSLNPNAYPAKYNLAQILLAESEFTKGWKHYDARFAANPKLRENRCRFKIPAWTHADRNKKTLLITPEQGLGDEILYSSLARKFLQKEKQKEVYWCSDPRLKQTFHRTFPDITFFDHSELPAIDIADASQIPLGSLGKFTINSAEDLPKIDHPGLIHNKQLTSLLRKKHSEAGKLLCGISWRSEAKEIGGPKSISTMQLLPAINLEKIKFINLQYGDTSRESQKLESLHKIKLHTDTSIDNENQIDDLLSLIAACDLVITISNVTAHLAGAINQTTFLLSPIGKGRLWYWRNMDRQGHSLWYPSVKILEQEEIGDWSAPIAKLKTILENR
jgi:tetratricopeptide (TPR) repeat protein